MSPRRLLAHGIVAGPARASAAVAHLGRPSTPNQQAGVAAEPITQQQYDALSTRIQQLENQVTSRHDRVMALFDKMVKLPNFVTLAAKYYNMEKQGFEADRLVDAIKTGKEHGGMVDVLNHLLDEFNLGVVDVERVLSQYTLDTKRASRWSTGVKVAGVAVGVIGAGCVIIAFFVLCAPAGWLATGLAALGLSKSACGLICLGGGLMTLVAGLFTTYACSGTENELKLKPLSDSDAGGKELGSETEDEEEGLIIN